MGAPKGNNNAQKWSQADVLALLKRAHESIDENCYFLSEVSVAAGVYPKLFTYLLKKYVEDWEIFSSIERLYTKCEAIITRKTANGSILASLGIFILKSYHNLIETSKIKHEGGDESKPIRIITDKEGQTLLESIIKPN